MFTPHPVRQSIQTTSARCLRSRPIALQGETRRIALRCIQDRQLHISSRASAKWKPRSALPASPPPPVRKIPHKSAAPEPSPKGKQNKKGAAEYLSEPGRKPTAVGLALVVMIIGGYVTQLALSIYRTPSPSCSLNDVPTGRPLDLTAGKIQATQFDKDLDHEERAGGITGLRKVIGGHARGHVLEVAVGTGRLMEHIDWDDVKAMAPAPTIDGEPVPDWKPMSPRELLQQRAKRRLQKSKNGKYLPEEESPEILSFTGVDVSTDVLEVAWTKVKRLLPDIIPKRRRKREGEEPDPAKPQSTTTTASAAAMSLPNTDDKTLAVNLAAGRIRLFHCDAQETLPSPPQLVWPDGRTMLDQPSKYDTILQTFGLCSVSDPVQLLANMAAVVQPHTGRIYLLEHGRGWYDFLNRWCDKGAPHHFEKFGCWYNRDIEAILREAERSVPGLQALEIKRPLWRQFGTMFLVELKYAPGASRSEDTTKKEPVKEEKKKTWTEWILRSTPKDE